MTTKFKVGDEVAKVGTVMQVQKSDKIAPYLVQFNDGDTDWCREGKLTAIDAAPGVPQPPQTVQVGSTVFALDTIALVRRTGKLVIVDLKVSDGRGECVGFMIDYDLPHVKAFYEWWQSNTVMRFVPEATDDES